MIMEITLLPSKTMNRMNFQYDKRLNAFNNNKLLEHRLKSKVAYFN